jgi:hypothetical protein
MCKIIFAIKYSHDIKVLLDILSNKLKDLEKGLMPCNSSNNILLSYSIKL